MLTEALTCFLSFLLYEVIYLPHRVNKDLAIFTHITTESGKDIKMTPSHIIPSGVCGVNPLPLLFASQGMKFRFISVVIDDVYFLFYFHFFLNFIFVLLCQCELGHVSSP
jgi:hypothetical protein